METTNPVSSALTARASLSFTIAHRRATEAMSTEDGADPPEAPLPRDLDHIAIIDVWEDNLHEEFDLIMEIINEYPFVAMDTEFPGVVAKPTGQFKSSSDFHYQTMRCNVNLLRIIQIGIAFSDRFGRLPPHGRCCWQFHFQFDLKEDIYAQDSIELLDRSGIQFERHRRKGIRVSDFAELLTVSGLVLNDCVRWVSFHSCYDFGYLVKILSGAPLPPAEQDFFELLRLFFPYIYDVKYLMRSCEPLKGGLSLVGAELGCARVGPAHQAGSDSLLTLDAFFAMMSRFFEDKFDDQRNIGVLYGLGEGWDKDEESAGTTFQSIPFVPRAVPQLRREDESIRKVPVRLFPEVDQPADSVYSM